MKKMFLVLFALVPIMAYAQDKYQEEFKGASTTITDFSSLTKHVPLTPAYRVPVYVAKADYIITESEKKIQTCPFQIVYYGMSDGTVDFGTLEIKDTIKCALFHVRYSVFDINKATAANTDVEKSPNYKFVDVTVKWDNPLLVGSERKWMKDLWSEIKINIDYTNGVYTSTNFVGNIGLSKVKLDRKIDQSFASWFKSELEALDDAFVLDKKEKLN